MKIPVFVSCPTALSPSQDACRKLVLRELDHHNLEPRAIGRSDYPTGLALREVIVLARHCSGGVILGFEQFHAPGGIWKRGAKEQRKQSGAVRLPSPWNHMEAAVLFGLGLPLLVFAEEGIAGGVFDTGVTDAFVAPMPSPGMDADAKRGFKAVFQKWQAGVRSHYYR